MHSIIWLLPIIFMIHDFEEILMMKAWLKRNHSDLLKRFPRFAEAFLNYYQQVSTASFALGVACLFFFLSLVTFVSEQIGDYHLWFGLFMIYSLHLLIHIGQWFIFRKYVPAVITSILTLPYSIYALIIITKLRMFNVSTTIIWTIIGLVFTAGIGFLIQWSMPRFNRWLSRFAQV